GTPGGAGRVVHHDAARAVGRGGRRLARLQRVIRPETGDVAADGEATVGREVDLVGRRRCVVGEVSVRDERLRLTVVHDVRDLGADEVPVDRDQVETRLTDRE